MKMQIVPVLLALAVLAGCAPAAQTHMPGPTPPASEIPTGAEWADYFAQVILYSQSDRADYTALSAEDGAFCLTQLYGIEVPDRPDGGFGYAVYTAGGVDAREVAVVFGLSSPEKAHAAAAGMEAYRQGRVGDFTGYAPDQAALAEEGAVLDGNGAAVLLLCADPDAAQAALNEAAPGQAWAPYDPAAEEGYDWTDYLDEDGYKIFDPPGEFHMVPYDTSAILTAWETGDERGLSEKDAAVLAKCREAMALCVREGMTDFRKELDLHDWLVQSYYGCYDWTVQDPRTPLGREDNLTPYGLLVRGYGVCLAYATTFQLLMDMAGVECVTVIGAASSSSGDHAWNMVRLEGEWYCVDPSWDATYLEGLSQEEVQPWQHRYFNVTSEYMRQTDHQWDYRNVPEATAVRFHWDGTGELPG